MNDFSFLVSCLHYTDSCRILTDSVPDMPSVYIGMIFESDRDCDEILF